MITDNAIEFSKIFLQKTDNKKIHLVSHYDTDGITSAAIFTRTLERLGKQFSAKILKQLSSEEIKYFPQDRVIIILDLGSSSIEELSKLKTDVMIIDHHEINIENLPKNITILNPHLYEDYENLCSAELSYLVSRSLSEENKDLSHLAIIGMVGDTMEKEITKTRNRMIKEADVKIRKGLLLYPSTRPIDKTLEYSSRPYIPGVTGDVRGTFEILKEAEIERREKNFPSLIDLTDEEMKNLVTAVTLRLNGDALINSESLLKKSGNKDNKTVSFIGNLYLIKFFNKIEDARELSAIINACSRMDKPEISLLLCLGNSNARKKAEGIYLKYRQSIISALKYIDKENKIIGREYVIINGKDQIKDTIIGTLASILSFSQVYKEGTIIIAMAYNEDKIKVSTRLAGRGQKSGRNLKDLMESITVHIGGEAGGHKEAAGCTFKKEHEDKFIELVKKKLEYELVQV